MFGGRDMSSRGNSSNPQTRNQNNNNNNNNQQRRRRRNRRFRNRRGGRRSIVYQSRAPVSRSVTIKSYANIKTMRDGNVHLEFSEVFPVTFSKYYPTSFFLLVNPAKWVSRRTQMQSRLYSSFRPLKLHVNYFPSVSTATPGLFSFGALYGTGTIDAATLSTTLPQTEGGFMTSIWQRFHTVIPCKTKLSQNNYRLTDVDRENIPITLMGACSNTQFPDTEPSVPIGFIMVSGVFSLVGPRTEPADPNVSGEVMGTVSASNQQVSVSAPKTDNMADLKPGDTFSAEVLGVNQATGNDIVEAFKDINWQNIFQTFRTVVCTVLEVTETIIRIAVAVAPFFLANFPTEITNANTIVKMEIIGRTDFQ